MESSDMDTPSTSYTVPARLLHWTMAGLLLAMIPAGFMMVLPGLDKSVQNALFIFHKNTGVLLLVLAIVRIAYRLRRPAPPLPDHIPAWQARAARASHLALYLLMIIMPLAGYIRVKAGGFPIETLDAMGFPSLVARSDTIAGVAKGVHYFGAFAITALVIVHILASVYHGIIKRDGGFSRIWPPVVRHRR
jgi:cytochrome b561